MTNKKSIRLEEQFQCPLCGYQFNWKEGEQCHTCPNKKHCGLVMCPRCNYEFQTLTSREVYKKKKREN
jgi:uncharacterized Zn finger protein (UPF0148 family)